MTSFHPPDLLRVEGGLILVFQAVTVRLGDLSARKADTELGVLHFQAQVNGHVLSTGPVDRGWLLKWAATVPARESVPDSHRGR